MPERLDVEVKLEPNTKLSNRTEGKENSGLLLMPFPAIATRKEKVRFGLNTYSSNSPGEKEAAKRSDLNTDSSFCSGAKRG